MLVMIVPILFSSCRKTVDPEITDRYVYDLPEGFPMPDIPADNPMTKSKVELGKRLFYDPIFSRTGTISCGTCHQPDLALTDGLAKSRGVENREVARNSPSLANIVYHPYFMREGALQTLEQQVLVPIQEHAEFDYHLDSIVNKLNADPAYQEAFMESFDEPADRLNVLQAISAFERTIISGNSTYDKVERGEQSYTSLQARGKELFFDVLDCGRCHGGFNFTDYSFKSNGLYEEYPDPGKYRLTLIKTDSGVFKVPSLRNVALTAPYMHDGSMTTLEQVVRHYESGGKDFINKDPGLLPFTLSDTDRDALIEFLRSLTDLEFVNNPDYRP